MSSNVKIRTYLAGDEDEWFRLLREAYGNLESRSLDDIVKSVSSESFSADWLFLAEVENQIIGSIRVKPLPCKGSYELWDLAVSRKYRQSQVPGLLLDKALSYFMEEKAEMVRGYTLSIEPYVSAYIDRGLKPKRRILRIDWNLLEELPPLRTREDICIKEASSYDPETITRVYVKALTPFWNWWIKDHGGPEELARIMKARFFSISNELKWFVAEQNEEPVGLTGYTSRNGKGRFFGVYVLPERRTERIGSTLMNVVLDGAKRSEFKSLRVYTVAFLDRLAPAAVLYLKSGGRISAEYLQFE